MIGIFDSGIGGLSVVSELKKINPKFPVMYFGDTARYPWGNKSADTIISYADEISRFFIEQGIKEIIIACNTASALASEHLKNKYTQIKFYNVIDPVIEKIKLEAEKNKNYKVGIIGTTGTIRSNIYRDKIKKVNSKIEVIQKACPLFVPLVEEGLIQHAATKLIAKEYLDNIKDSVDVLVLGCTHYPYLEEIILDILDPKVNLISSAREIAKEVANMPRKLNANDVYYFSDITDSIKTTLGSMLKNKFVIKKKIF
ncbi:MAG: glutamate racemase [Parcubacteria group bacterium]|jgi:glutamate racemase